MNPFVRDDVMPSWWANSIQKFLAVQTANFVIRRKAGVPTTIEVAAGADDKAAVIAVDGKWRWNEATVSRAHPGGGAGTYDIFVTAAANDITNSPDPGSDHTSYAFGLAIVAHNATPAVVAGVVDIFDKVGELTWDGAQVASIRQSRGDVPGDGTIELSAAASSLVNAFLGIDDQSVPRRLKWWPNVNPPAGLGGSFPSTTSWTFAHGEGTDPVVAWGNGRTVAIQERGGVVGALVVNVLHDATNIQVFASAVGTSNNGFGCDIFAIF